PANVLVKKSLVGYGYLTVTVDNAKLNINVNQVTVDHATMQEKSTLFDSAEVNLTGSNLGTRFEFPGWTHAALGKGARLRSKFFEFKFNNFLCGCLTFFQL